MGDFAGNMLEDAGTQAQRRDRHALELGRFRIAGDEIEDARHIASNHRIGREKGKISVDASGDRMIVASADVHVRGQ